PRDERPEIVDRDLAEPQHRMEARIGLGEEIRVAVERAAAGVEDDSFGMDRRRINVLLGMDVADVVGPDRQMRNAQRTPGVLVDVGDLPFADAEQVDLERIDLQQRLMPPAVLYRRGV